MPIQDLRPSQPIMPSLSAGGVQRKTIGIFGDSILAGSTLLTSLKSLVSGLKGLNFVTSYGCNQSPTTLFQLAPDVQAYLQPGNILPSTDLSNATYWAKTGTTVTTTISPTNKKPMQLLTASGVANQGIFTKTSGAQAIVAPVGATELTFSFEIEAPLIGNALTIQIVNSTLSQYILQGVTSLPVYLHSNFDDLPVRVAFTVFKTDGCGWSDGNTIYIALYYGNTPLTFYLKNFMCNVGVLPAPYEPTVGTPGTPRTVAWTSLPPDSGFDRGMFDTVVIMPHIRNDLPYGVDVWSYEQAVASMISAAAVLSDRVVVCMCPPLSLADHTVWDSSDTLVSSGYYAAVKRQAIRHGAYFYDARQDFINQVAAGSYTIAQLLTDIEHPTATGLGLYAKAIADYINAPYDYTVKSLVKTPCARIGGQVISGAWVWARYTYAALGMYFPGMVSTYRLISTSSATSQLYAMTAANTGVLQFDDVKGSNIGIIGLNNASVADTVNVVVDGVYSKEIVLQNVSNTTNYPTSYYVVTGIPYGSHTVQVNWVANNPKILAVVGW